MRTARVVLALAGLALAGFGGSLLIGLGVDNLVATLAWVIGGVVVHDALLAPLTVVAAAGLAALTRRRVPGAFVVGAVVLGTVTIAAIPVLGRFGARSDNTTLLDRSYGGGWLVFAGVTALLTMLGWLVGRRRHAERSGPGAADVDTS